ncbi:helix-turn-helix domain-containing protein [Streptomyces sp. NPDC048156]|uniref:helix-turn-helix domain-containing protein n=1 Tax=Streptomyces sp. NPDC048156 TaxID=3365502 RepID=UPI00371F61CD
MAAKFHVVPGDNGDPRDPLPSATPPARWLGLELKRLRANAGLTGAQVVASKAISSQAVLSRYETGNAAAKLTQETVHALAHLYGVGEGPEMQALLRKVEEAQSPRWWSSYTDVVDQALSELMTVESAADRIQTFSAVLVPGLLQTADYARAVMRMPFGRRTNEAQEQQIERRWAVRRRRQQILECPQPPEYCAIIDEGVLCRWVGGKAVIREQLRHLYNLAENRENVHIRILTGEAWAQASPTTSAATLFKFPDDGEPDLVYIEGVNQGGNWLNDSTDVDWHRSGLDELIMYSTDKAETLQRLDQLIRGLAD